MNEWYYLFTYFYSILPVLFEVVSGTAEEAVAKSSIKKTLEQCQLTTLKMKITYFRAVITMD
jgi:hypothetical protein